jgi:hypothetical protein
MSTIENVGNPYLEKIAEMSDLDISLLAPAAGVSIPGFAAGLAQYSNLKVKDRFETAPHQRELNKALRANTLKMTAGLTALSGGMATAVEIARRNYLENQKNEQNKELKQALRTTIRQELA